MNEKTDQEIAAWLTENARGHFGASTIFWVRDLTPDQREGLVMQIEDCERGQRIMAEYSARADRARLVGDGRDALRSTDPGQP